MTGHKWTFFYRIYPFWFWIQHGCLANMNSTFDSSNNVTKKLWWFPLHYASVSVASQKYKQLKVSLYGGIQQQ